jgi:hypothetical protein
MAQLYLHGDEGPSEELTPVVHAMLASKMCKFPLDSAKDLLRPHIAQILTYLLNVIVRKGATILKLFSGENQSLLVWGDAFLVLDFGFDIINSVRGLDLKGDSLARKGLDEAIIIALVSSSNCGKTLWRSIHLHWRGEKSAIRSGRGFQIAKTKKSLTNCGCLRCRWIPR